MRTKVRVLANIYVEGHVDESLFQFNRAVSIYYYHAIRAFVKNCPLIKNATEEDFQTIILITILCSNDENAMTILHGLEGCAKNSFFDELTRKKANAVDTEAIKITLNSVYGKGAFNRDTDSVDADINYVVDNLDSDDLFLQMAEEAAKLSQACLKYVRAHKGNNPTKDSEDVYLKGIIEEFTDVQVCADAIDITADSDIHDSKIHRWADRIRKKNGGVQNDITR